MALADDIERDLMQMRGTTSTNIAKNIEADLASIRSSKPQSFGDVGWRDAGANDPQPTINNSVANAYLNPQGAKSDRQNAYGYAVQNGLIPSNEPSKPEGKETDGNGVLDWFKDGIDAGAASALAGQAHFLETNTGIGGDAAKYLDEVAERNKREKQYSAKDMVPFASDYWTNPQGAVYTVGNTVGSAGALMTEAAGVGVLASMLPGGAVAGSAATIASRFPTLARFASTPLGKLAVLNVTKTPFEAMSEGGGIVPEMRKAGYSEDEIKSATRELAAYNTLFLTGSNTAESLGMGLLGKGITGLGEKGLKEGAKAVAKRGAIGAAGGGLQNAFEERTQTALSNDVMGRPTGNWYNPSSWTQEEVDSAAEGGVGGAVLGGAGGVVGGVTGGRQQAGTNIARNIEADLDSIRGDASSTTALKNDFDSQLPTFIDALVGIESGGRYDAIGPDMGGDRALGKYQIMQSNWPSWAEAAGIGRDASWESRENQDRVFRHKIKEYYNQYGGDWGKVAIAWHAGPGRTNLSDEQLAKLNDGNMSTLDYRNAILGKMGNVSAAAPNFRPSTPQPIQFTPEEQQQAVTWLEDKIPDLQVDNIEQANYIESEIAKKNVEKLLADYKVEDDNGQEVPLGQYLFPEKFQQRQEQNQQDNLSPGTEEINMRLSPTERDYIQKAINQEINSSKDKEWKSYLSGIKDDAGLVEFANNYTVGGVVLREKARQANLDNARLAINGAQSNLAGIDTVPVKPFVSSEKQVKQQDLANILHAIAAGKFDEAEQQIKDLKASRDLMAPAERMDIGATMPQKTQLPGHGMVLGERSPQEPQRPEIALPNQSASNPAGVQTVQQLQRQVTPPTTILPTTDEVMLKRKLMQAVSYDKDYYEAAKIADTLNMPEKATMYRKIAETKPQGGNVRQRITGDMIRQSVARNTLTDIENLYVDLLEHYKVSSQEIESQIAGQYNGFIKDYIETLKVQVRQPGISATLENKSGDRFSRTYSQNFKWYMDLARQTGYSANKIPKNILDKSIPQIALKHLRNGYTDPIHGEFISEELSQQFNDMEAAIHGITSISEKISGAIPETLREPDAGGQSGDRTVRTRAAAEAAIPIAREFGRAAGRDGGEVETANGTKIKTGNRSFSFDSELRIAHTGQFRPFSFGQEPQYGVTHEIPLGDGTIERCRFILEKSYKKDEQAISELGQYMGVPVRFFIARRELRGFYDPETGISYINRNGNRGVEWTFWHENLHWMKEQDPVLYRDILSDVQQAGIVTPEQIAEYRKTIAQGDTLTDTEAIEEMLADEFADNAKRQAWLQQLQRRDAGLFERFVEWIKSLVAQMKSQVGENSKLTEQQVKAFENAARRTLLSLKDADGNRLFQDRTEFPYQELPAGAVQFSSGSNDVNQFIDEALKDKKSQQTLLLRPVTAEEAGLVKDKIGIDVTGYSHYLNAADLRHIINKHGVHAEGSDGQIPLTEKDLELIPSILSSPQDIQKGNPTQREGLPTIRYMKSDDNGVYTVVEVVHGRNKKLVVKTMWKKSTARHRASNADPLHTSTSVFTLTPGGGSTSSNESVGAKTPKQDSVTSIVQQDQKNVNVGQLESVKDIEAKWTAMGANVFLYEKGDTITLSKIVIPKERRNEGAGSAFMQDLIQYADKTGKTIKLTPSADFGGSVSRLKEFYKRFGFIENKGHNKDYAISELFYREPQNEKDVKETKTKLSFAGSHAKTADKNKLSEAQTLESQTASNETIRQKTGWFKGMDNKWRFEINDSQANIKFDESTSSDKTEWLDWIDEAKDRVTGVPLSRVLEHDSLFQAYPELNYVRVKVDSSINRLEAHYSPGEGKYGTITLPDVFNLPTDQQDRLINVLLHEVQHVIQEREDFARGGSSSDMALPKMKAKNNWSFWSDALAVRQVMEEEGKTFAEAVQSLRDIDIDIDPDVKMTAIGYDLDFLQKKSDEAYEALKKFKGSDFEQYQRLAGEIEARDAAGRSSLSSEQRRQHPPVLQEDAIVHYSGGVKFSADAIGEEALKKLNKQLGAAPNVTVKPHNAGTSVGVLSRWLNSVAVIAKDHPKVKSFVHIAAKAREKQEDLRQHFKHRADKWTKMLKRGDYQENKAAWSDLLWKGDALEKDFTTNELRESGYNDDVIRAYRMVREAIKHAYKLANDVRQEARVYSKRMSGAELEDLKKKPFREVLSEKQVGQDEYLVSYRAPKIREHEGTLSRAELEALKSDPNVHVISDKPVSMTGHILPGSSGLARGDDFFNVKWEEQKPPIGNRTGYMPHFFHQWLIQEQVMDENTGEIKSRMLGSGKTMREAVKKANEIAKGQVQGKIVVQPKQFQFPGAAEQAALVGDKDYFKMVQKVAEDLSIDLGDANTFLSDKVHMKNRHRFVGNFMKRTGAKGFEKDLDWVLSHYFNMIGRYVALDPFKHEAISRFERVYGSYDGRHDGEALYVRNYIDDVLGVPTQIEKDVNSWLEKHPRLRAWLGNYLGDRPALELAGNLTGLASALKLNFINVASTMLQLTQFINLAGSINSYDYAFQGLKRALRPNMRDKMILHRSGIQSSLGIDNAAGYSKAGVKRWIQYSTVSFRYADGLIRRASVLAAYQQALDQGKNQGEALQYAKEINQKANFEYAVDNAPDIFRRGGPASQVLLQFQKFPIMQTEYMLDMLMNGSKGQKARFFVPYFLLAGIWGVPFVDLFGTLLGGLLGEDWEKEMKKATFEWASRGMLPQESKALVKWLWYGGIPGVDIASRVGIGGFGTTRMPKDVREGLGRMFGVTGDTIYNVIRQTSQGNHIEAIKAITPGVGNILQAVAGETKGKRGRTQTRYEETMSRVIKALGFMPIDESLGRDRDWIINAEKQHMRDEVAEAIDDYIRAVDNNDTATKQKASKRLSELKVSPLQVMQERKRKRMTNTERTESLIPKKYRTEFRNLQEFE